MSINSPERFNAPKKQPTEAARDQNAPVPPQETKDRIITGKDMAEIMKKKTPGEQQEYINALLPLCHTNTHLSTISTSVIPMNKSGMPHPNYLFFETSSPILKDLISETKFMIEVDPKDCEFIFPQILRLISNFPTYIKFDLDKTDDNTYLNKDIELR